MTTRIPPHATVRRPLRYIAFWQGMAFLLLACALWASESLGLLREGPPDFRYLVIPTILLFCGALIAVGHTHLQEHRVLRGLVAICSYCHKIRTSDQSWTRVEQFISQHSRADFTHGVCPDCYRRLEQEIDDMDAGTGKAASPASGTETRDKT